MANFTLTNGSTAGAGTQQACAASYVGHICATFSSTTNPRRAKWYDILVGTNGAPADNFMEFNVSRTTSGSTIATIQAAAALDSADTTLSTITTVNSTNSSSLATVPDLWYIGMNQRASYRWVCAPGSELVLPATSSAGIIITARSGSYTGTVTGTVMFQEQ